MNYGELASATHRLSSAGRIPACLTCCGRDFAVHQVRIGFDDSGRTVGNPEIGMNPLGEFRMFPLELRSAPVSDSTENLAQLSRQEKNLRKRDTDEAQNCVLLHPAVFLGNARQVFILNGRPVGTRTPGLYRVNNNIQDRGIAKVRGCSYNTYFLWIGLWVRNPRTEGPVTRFLRSREPSEPTSKKSPHKWRFVRSPPRLPYSPTSSRQTTRATRATA